MGTRVRFSYLGRGGQELSVPDTHLDHRSQYARERVVFLLSERRGVMTGAVIDHDQSVFGGQD